MCGTSPTQSSSTSKPSSSSSLTSVLSAPKNNNHHCQVHATAHALHHHVSQVVRPSRVIRIVQVQVGMRHFILTASFCAGDWRVTGLQSDRRSSWKAIRRRHCCIAQLPPTLPTVLENDCHRPTPPLPSHCLGQGQSRAGAKPSRSGPLRTIRNTHRHLPRVPTSLDTNPLGPPDTPPHDHCSGSPAVTSPARGQLHGVAWQDGEGPVVGLGPAASDPWALCVHGCQHEPDPPQVCPPLPLGWVGLGGRWLRGLHPRRRVG